MPVSPPARIQHTIHLLPQNTSLAELEQVTARLHPSRSAFTYSADVAHAVAHHGDANSKVVVWAGERWGANGAIFTWLHQRGAATEARHFDGTAVADHFSNPTANKTTPTRLPHTTHLLPQDASLPELRQVTTQLHPTLSAFTYSADAAHALMFAGDEASKVVVWSGERWSGNIFAWLHDRGIQTETQRFVASTAVTSAFIFTHWPTERQVISQRFNANPHIYKNIDLGPGQPRLTGHDGLDIEASFGSQVFAAAPGRVSQVRAASENHNYGIAVYIQHPDGYRTAYAHLREARVKKDDMVTGGQLIGLADSTGNVWPKPTPEQPHLGSHLHLTLYLNGASARGETPQPYDLIDPEPYLQHLQAGWQTPQEPFVQGWAYAPGIEISGLVARVQSSFINLRAQPGARQEQIGRVNHGEVMRLIGNKTGDYYPVAVPETAVARPNTAVEIGVHNENGAAWMKQNGLTGWALHTIALGITPQNVDLRAYESAGIKMLLRLNYGYNPEGNLPRENSPDYPLFINACIETMRRAKGVWGFIFGNETNNPHEFPGGANGAPITPEQYARAYNQLWSEKPAGARLGVQATDPYFGPGSDNRDYWQRILNNALGTDFLTVHPKTQDSRPDNVDSDGRFADHPLTWQFLHLRAYQTLLDAVPERFRNLPVIATEVNPQRFNDGATLGWQVDQGPEWVRRAVAHFRAYNEQAIMPVSGIVFYRFSDDEWSIGDKPAILEAIKQVV